jgi:hypothetical protein
MISTTHITVGAALGLTVGSMIPNPVIAIPVAFVVGAISHHLLDPIPHTDPGSWRDPNDKDLVKKEELPFALADNIIGTVIILWIFFTREPSWPMLFGAAGGNFPDIFHHVPAWGHKTRMMFNGLYFAMHEKYHWTARGGLIPLGILTNVLLIAVALWYILSFSA